MAIGDNGAGADWLREGADDALRRLRAYPPHLLGPAARTLLSSLSDVAASDESSTSGPDLTIPPTGVESPGEATMP